MVAFINPLREQKRRSLAGNQMKAVIVNNDDSKHEDKVRGSRVQARIETLHANIKDADLPWFSPKQLHSANGGQGGAHGPIPPVGTVVHVEFRDDSQYHGQYMAGPQDEARNLDEFTNPKTKHGKDYPHVHGGVDYSGSLHAANSKTDSTERTHVSGTSHKVDGKGNVLYVINGDAETKNKDAAKEFPKGGTIIAYGDANLWVSGKVVINAQGNADVVVAGTARVSAKKDASVIAGQNASVSAKQNASVVAGKDLNATAKGKVTVAAEGEAQVSSKSTLHLSASSAIKFNAPSITSSVPIVLAGGKGPADAGSAADPAKVQSGSAPKPRRRPDPKAPKDDPAGEAAGPDQEMSAQESEAEGKEVASALDEAEKSALRVKAQAELVSKPDQQEVELETKLPSGETYKYKVTRDT